MRPDLQSTDLGELLARSTRRHEQLVARPMIVDVPDGLPLVQADHAQLEQVVNNLLDNIVRHTPAGTIARVGASATPTSVVVTIADDGPGLPTDVCQRLASGSRASTGLGLAICKAIVELHAGTLTVGEASRGTSILVAIPRSK
jgi:signal transduction histidine kinase